MIGRLVVQMIAVGGISAALSCGDDAAGAAPTMSSRAGAMAQSVAGSTSTNEPVESDPRCPAVTLGTTMLPSCCDANGMCGINSAMFGTPICIDLATAADQAAALGARRSDYPPPRACDADKD